MFTWLADTSELVFSLYCEQISKALSCTAAVGLVCERHWICEIIIRECRTDVWIFCTFKRVYDIVNAEHLLSMAVAKYLQAVTWLVALWYTKVQCLSPFYMVCSCFVHIELHGYGRLQKKQIVNKIRRGPILPQSEKAPRRKWKVPWRIFAL